MLDLSYRSEVYESLEGRGLEIGALHQPVPLNHKCHVEYCDVISEEEAKILFPEISHCSFVPIDYKVNLDTDGLVYFANETYDFVILNHVLEHLVNPIYILEEIFRILKEGGFLVISVPDKEFTFDKSRPLSTFQNLQELYNKKITYFDDSYYDELLSYPEYAKSLNAGQTREECIKSFRDRREHLHVWTSSSFKDFMLRTVYTLNLYAVEIYANCSDTNNFEYFGVWQKLDPETGSTLRKVLESQVQ